MERTLLKLNQEDIRQLQDKGQPGRVNPGRLLVREGHPPAGLFIVRRGEVLVQRKTSAYAITTATLGPNAMFGETAFICPAPQPALASVVAATETDVILLAPERVQPLLDVNPGLCHRFFQSIALELSRRLRAFNGQAGGHRTDRFGDLPSWEVP